MEMGKAMLVNECFLCQAETPGHRVDSHLYALPRFRHHTLPIIFAAISGHSSIQGTGPLSKFFRQLGQRLGSFLNLLTLIVFS